MDSPYTPNMDVSNNFGINLDTFDFSKIEPVAFEQTIAQLNAYAPPMSEFAGNYSSMVDEVVMEKDWLDVALEAEAEEKRDFERGGLDVVGPEDMAGLQDEASESR